MGDTQKPEPVAVEQGAEFATLEPWEYELQRELLRLYNHSADDSLQFNRGQMRTAIQHGMRLAERARLTTDRSLGAERYRHLKRGTVYEVIGTAELQAEQLQGDHAALTIYRAEDGKLWARNTAEFHDGRFELLAATPPVPATDHCRCGQLLDFTGIEPRETLICKCGTGHSHPVCRGEGSANQRVTPATSEPVCEYCNGRGVIETGAMENGPGGWGYQTVDCECERGVDPVPAISEPEVTREMIEAGHAEWLTMQGGGYPLGAQHRRVFLAMLAAASGPNSTMESDVGRFPDNNEVTYGRQEHRDHAGRAEQGAGVADRSPRRGEVGGRCGGSRDEVSGVSEQVGVEQGRHGKADAVPAISGEGEKLREAIQYAVEAIGKEADHAMHVIRASRDVVDELENRERRFKAVLAALATPDAAPIGSDDAVDHSAGVGKMVPESMRPWHGDERAPDDWDGGPVLRRDGSEGIGRRWKHDFSHDDIIAYTPKVAQ